MKKTFAILIAVVLVLSLAVNAVASGSQAIILGNAKFTEKGEEQVITIEAENLDSISVISLVLAYDSTKIELQNVVESEETGFTVGQVKGAAGNLVGDAYVCCPEKGIITIIWEKEKTVSGSGVIANLSFKALTADAGVQKLTFTTYDEGDSYLCRDDENDIPKIVNDVEWIEKSYGVTVSGTVTSYLDANETVTIGLYEGENAEPSYETAVTGNSAEYSIPEVAAGTYTMKVSKANHVTREYEVTVETEDVVQDVKIHPLGDISGDGRIIMVDYLRAKQHAQSIQFLSGYEFECADINGDGRVVLVDYMRIRQHAQNISKLW